MKIVTAPEEYEIRPDDVTVFLAGGITGCPDWQKETIKIFTDYIAHPYLDNLNHDTLEHLVIFNPRREEFDVSNHSEATAQINWEFKYLNQIDIFTMYLCKETLQPICLYELGRYIEVMKRRFPETWHKQIIISANSQYERVRDVIDQVNLAYEGEIPNLWIFKSTLERHSYEIFRAAEEIVKSRGGK